MKEQSFNIKMKRAIIALAISIIVILGTSRYLANQQTANNECDEIKEETYAVCVQENKYFKENLR